MAGLARAVAIEALALTSSVAGGAQVGFTAVIPSHYYPEDCIQISPGSVQHARERCAACAAGCPRQMLVLFYSLEAAFESMLTWPKRYSWGADAS